jgi:1,4-dihydroxy-2-naphthoate octaprenyltransferase
MPEGRGTEICSMLSDRLRVPWVNGAKRIDLGSILPFFLIPIWALVATLGPVWTFTSFISVPIVIQVLRKRVFARQKTKFYWTFTLSSFFYSYLVRMGLLL